MDNKATEIEVRVTVRQAEAHSWENKTIASAHRCEASVFSNLDAVGVELDRLCLEARDAAQRQLGMTKEVFRIEEAKRIEMLRPRIAAQDPEGPQDG